MTVTSLYAALVAFVLIALSVRTIGLRRKYQVGIGHGGEPELERAMRVHANFCEYVPIGLLLILLVELGTGSSVWIHALGLALLVGRLSHAFGVSQVAEDLRIRVAGMALTFTVIGASALAILAGHAGLIGG